MVIPQYRTTLLHKVFIYDGQQFEAAMRTGEAGQEFLAFNWIKKHTGIPGIVSLIARTSGRPLETNRMAEDEDGFTKFGEQGEVLMQQTRLVLNIFKEGIRDVSLEEQAKEVMNEVSLVV